jgi:RNA polymerase sigma-70 factor (ECF subfamily)
MDSFSTLTRRLRATLLRRGASMEDAEDMVQEAYVRMEAYQQANQIDEPEAFLVRTTMNLSIDSGRRRKRSPFSRLDLDQLHLADCGPGPGEILEARDRLRRMLLGLEKLNERPRAILLAHRVEGLTCPEIARREGVSVSAVEKHIARSVAFLTNWMEGW